jgi:hypothetical protein
MKSYTLLSVVAAISFVWPAATAADKAALHSHYLSYHAAGKAIIGMALARKVDAAEVEKKVNGMVTDAVWYAGEYAKAFPEGQKLLKVVVANVEAMRRLSFKELEREWHDLHHFDAANDTGVDLKAEENEHFTDPIHSIVHPLLVLKAAQSYAAHGRAEDLKAIKEETEEGLEQLERQKYALSK